MMNYQLIVRNQRPKGLTVKQALQFVLLLAVGIWLLYQIKHSHGDHNESTRSRLKEEQSSNIMGRKGISRWSNQSGYTGMYMKDVNLMAENEKKEYKESHDSHVYEGSNFAIQVGREDEATSKKGTLNEEFIEKEMESVEDVEGKIKNPRKNKENITGNLLHDSDGAVTEKYKKDFLVQQVGLANTSISVSLLDDNNEVVKENDEKDETHSFHDENGVPQDPNDESIQDDSIEFGSQSTMTRRLPIEDLKSSGALNIDHASDMQGNVIAFVESGSISS